MASIYELNGSWQTVYQMIDDEEVDEQAIIDTLESIECEIEEKADNYAMVIRNITSDVSGIDSEIKRLQKKKSVMENRIKAMKNNLQYVMLATGKKKFKTPLFSFNIQKAGGKRTLTILKDVNEIPNEFHIKQDDIVDKNKVRDYLKENNIDDCEFARLEPQSENLIIR